jgi:hypothetical protein
VNFIGAFNQGHGVVIRLNLLGVVPAAAGQKHKSRRSIAQEYYAAGIYYRFE